jgi:hypothetical protein
LDVGSTSPNTAAYPPLLLIFIMAFKAKSNQQLMLWRELIASEDNAKFRFQQETGEASINKFF